MIDKHLWEVEHSYYCNEGNYYNNECGFEYSSWQDFMDEMGTADADYNLLFRWDWKEEDDDGNCNYKGDPYYRNGKLSLFYMHQRKGRYTYCNVKVCRKDEDAVIEFLKPNLAHLIGLWAPL